MPDTGVASNEATILATLKDNTSEGVDKLRKRLGGLKDDAEKAGNSVASAGAKGKPAFEQVNQTLDRTAKVATFVVIGIKGVETAITAGRAAWKYFQGDVNGAKMELQALGKELDETIRSIPVAGQAIAGLGAKINDLVTGDVSAANKAMADAAAGVQRAQQMRDRNTRETAQLDAARPFGTRFTGEDDGKIEELRRTVERMEQEQKTNSLLRDKAGNITDAGREFNRGLITARRDLKELEDQREKLRNERLEDLKAAKDQFSGANPHAADDLAFSRQQAQDQKEYLAKHGSSASGFEEFQQLQQVQKAQHDVAEAVTRRSEAESKLNEQLANNAHLVETGSISIWEADRRNAVAQKEYEAAIEATRAELVKLKEAATDPAIQAGIQKQIDALPPHISAVQKELNKLGGEIRDSMQQPMEGFFKGIITGSTSAKQAFKNMVAGFADNLASLAANKLATAILGGGGTGAGGGLGGLIGSFFTAKNSGGWIPGSGPDVDSVAAALTPGEYVVRRRSAQQAPRLLAAINAGHISDRVLSSSSVGRYNVGGFVQPTHVPGAGAGGSGGPTIMPTVIITPEMARTIFAAGEDAFFEMLHRNPERMPRT